MAIQALVMAFVFLLIFGHWLQNVKNGSLHLKNLTTGRASIKKPNYNFPINILKTSRSVCSPGSKYDLVLLVKSGVYNLEARQEFRTFMQNQSVQNPNFKVGYVFSVGVPRISGGRKFNRDGNFVTLKGPAGDALEKYEGKHEELLQNVYAEIGQFDDIILADYEDTYFNLSWKTVTNLRWLSAFCDKSSNDFFMIIDDDHRVNIELIEKFKHSTPTKMVRTNVFGRIGYGDPVYRSPNEKWFMSYNEIPWDRVAPYPRGMSQIIGADVVDSMAIATAFTKHSYLNEDVYLGIIVQKLDIPLRSASGMYDHDEYGRYDRKKNPAMVALKKFFL